jgi:hypothetical protein
MNIKDNEIRKDKLYINNLKEVIKDLKKEFSYKNIKLINNKNNNKKNYERINMKIQLNNLKNKAHSIININNINNINHRNYVYNNSINNLYRINLNKNINGKQNFRYRNKNSDNFYLNRADSNSNMNFSYKYDINPRQKNQSLPSVKIIDKSNNNIKIYKIKDNQNKNQFISFQNKYINLIKEPKPKQNKISNRLVSKLLKKHFEISKNEEYENEKKEEIKGLFDKIIYNFDL